MRKGPLLSLLLLVPSPTIGVLCGMVLLPGTPIGQGLFFLSKLWILVLPAGWYFLVERERMTRGKTAAGGFRMGWITGLAISAFIVTMYLLFGQQLIDTAMVHRMAEQVGLANRTRYLIGATYWVCINSILEEYVWRWFVVQQCAKIMRPAAAVGISALAFTLHHILAMQVYFNWTVTLLSALAIGFAGALWSWMYLSYKTIWPGWLSHALVDITVFALGYVLIFC